MLKSYEEQMVRQREKAYMTVFALCFSDDGKHLAAGNNYGTVAIFSIHLALSSTANESCWDPVFEFKVFDGAIYTLASTVDFLICGGWGDIKAYRWTDILQKDPKVVWTLRVPHIDNLGGNETNSIVLKEDTLFSAGGDGVVYCWDMESGICKISSASEDGSVRIWDTRSSGEAVALMEPYKSEDCSRTSSEKWLGCVAVSSNDDWLVCGGGPSLAQWHLRSLSPTAVFDAPKCNPYVAMFYEDRVISGGSLNSVYHWNLNGDMISKVRCTSNTLYSIAIHSNDGNNKVLCASGSSCKVDLYTNFGYKALSLDFKW